MLSKSQFFYFFFSLIITLIIGFFIWNLFFNEEQLGAIKSKLFLASLSSDSAIIQITPEISPDNNEQISEDDNIIILTDEEKQNLLDDIQEKLDVISQQVQELVAQQNPEEPVKKDEDKKIEDQKDQDKKDDTTEPEETGGTSACTGQININTASAEDLDKITQVGPATAQKIIVGRPFRLLNDLLRVGGIGESTLQKIIEQGCAFVESLPAGGGGGGGSGGGDDSLTYQKILISEARISPISDRFVELYNPNNTDINLTGWYLQRKTSSTYTSFITKNDFSGKIIRAHDYFLISRLNPIADIILSDLTLTSNNSLALKNPDEKFSDEMSFGAILDGQSIGRKFINGIEQDTDNDLVDFEADTPTPKAENVKWSDPPALTDITPPEVVFDLSPTQNSLNFSVNFTITDPIVDTVSPSGVSSYVFQWQVQGDLIWQQDEPIIATTSSSTMPVVRDFTGEDGKTYNFQVKATDVAGNISDWLPAVPTTTQVIILPPPPVIKPILINRIQVAPIEQRFVELYNPNIQDVDLTGWYLQRKTAMASSWSSFVSSTNFEDKTILANGHFLISRELPNSDILLNITLSDNNSLVLKDSGRNIIDEVGYGSVSDFETSPAQNPAEFEILSRTAGMDTDNNSLDFSIINTTSPSNS